MQDQNLTKVSNPNTDIIQEFQLAQVPISEKCSKETGLRMSKKVWGYVTTGFGGYIYNRNARFLKWRNFANGTIDIQAMFQDRFQFNGKQNYIRLVWNTLQIVNRIISGLVGRWMDRNERIVVTATDDLSQKQKEDQYQQMLFIIENRKKLEQLQQASGVQMIPDDEIPADKEELLLWKQQFQRIPEEIENELGCNEVLASNGWFDVLKEKMLHDAAEVTLVGTYTWMDEYGVIHVDWVKPENMIYSASDYPDFRDCTWLGDAPDMKISTLRRMYGKEFHPDNPLALTEEELFKIAATAKEYKSITNLTWEFNVDWNSSWLRPYDEWNVRSIKFEVKTVDSEPYTVTTTPANTTYTRRGYPKDSQQNIVKPKENQRVIEDTYWNIYRGVYLPDTQTLLEWGLKDNMIRPQDPKEIGNAEFSYSFYMPQNYNMVNLSIPAKIEAAVDNMMLACLKMQQVISRMRPTGAAINTDALQEIDFGLGDNEQNKAVDPKKLYDQTGDIYYRGRDTEGNPIPVPIIELANSGFLGQMEGLIKDYQFWYQTLKDELGEDPNLISQALQPRVTSGNVDAAQQSANNATDYYYRAYAECMKMTSRKISCLIKDSIKYGAAAYREIIKQDINDRIFSTDIQLLPTQNEIQYFDAMLQNAINSNPELCMFLNQLQAMEIVKRDVKLAWVYYNQCIKKMKQWQVQMQQQNQQATIQGQIQSAQAAEQAKQQTEQLIGQMELDKVRVQEESASKTAVLAMVTQLLAKGEQIPPYLMPMINATVENIMIPMVAQNEGQKMALIQQMQQAQNQQQMPPQEQQPEQPNNQQPPPEQLAA